MHSSVCRVQSSYFILNTTPFCNSPRNVGPATASVARTISCAALVFYAAETLTTAATPTTTIITSHYNGPVITTYDLREPINNTLNETAVPRYKTVLRGGVRKRCRRLRIRRRPRVYYTRARERAPCNTVACTAPVRILHYGDAHANIIVRVACVCACVCVRFCMCIGAWVGGCMLVTKNRRCFLSTHVWCTPRWNEVRMSRLENKCVLAGVRALMLYLKWQYTLPRVITFFCNRRN